MRLFCNQQKSPHWVCEMLRLDRKKFLKKSHCSSGVSCRMSCWPDSSVSDRTCSWSLSGFSCNMLTDVPKTSMLLEFDIPEGDVVHFLTVLSVLFGCVFCMLMVLPKKWPFERAHYITVPTSQAGVDPTCGVISEKRKWLNEFESSKSLKFICVFHWSLCVWRIMTL